MVDGPSMLEIATALRLAKKAHTDYEETKPPKHDWVDYYAAYMHKWFELHRKGNANDDLH